MSNQRWDEVLEQGLSDEPPEPVFRARVLLDSTAAFVRARQRRAWWRSAPLGAAAVFLAALSFLLGRYSAPPPTTRLVTVSPPDTVAVPTDLVVWLDAARLFQQLGMEDRMNRALDCAGRLLPRDAATADIIRKRAFTAGGEGVESQSEHAGPSRTPDLNRSVERRNRIMAQSLGGYDREDGMD